MGTGRGGNKDPCSLCDRPTLRGSAAPLSSERLFFRGSLLLFFFFSDNCSRQKFYADLLILENSRNTPGCMNHRHLLGCSCLHCNCSGRWHPWEFHFSDILASGMKRLSCHNDALKVCVETPFLEKIII